MPLLQGRDLRYSPGSAEVLAGATLTVGEGERVGLVGTNGSGKSSLLRILAGEVEPDDGDVIRRRGLVLASVSQFLPAELRAQRVLDAVTAGGCEAHRAEALLAHLDLAGPALDLTAGELSGGEVNRLLLARAVAREPDLVLLDEPTNHLDVETVMLFQRFLLEHLRKAFVLVSHDRALLDSLTDRTLFVRGGQIRAFDLPYSRARRELLEQEAAESARREVQQKKIDRLEASKKRLAHWGHVYDNEKLSRRAQSMGKQIDKLRQSQQTAPWSDRRSLGVANDRPRADRLLDVEGLAVDTPGGDRLFQIDGLHVRRGDRVALLGINGCGKTSFLKQLRSAFGQELTPGIRFNPQVRLGYYDQELGQLDPERTLLATLRAVSDAPATRLRSALVGAGFPARDHERAVASLSGGEKSRLLFLVLELSQPNLVLLDEPTNHLDVEGCEALEDELLASELTVLFVSHDRRFSESVASRFVRIQDGVLEEVPSLERYFEELPPVAAVGAPPSRRAGKTGAAQVLDEAASEEEILARIIELEEKLSADIRRKPKHQKPKLQAAWREELAALNTRLS